MVDGVVTVGGAWRITIERPVVELAIYKGQSDQQELSVTVRLRSHHLSKNPQDNNQTRNHHEIPSK